jgi:hypothetical protein
MKEGVLGGIWLVAPLIAGVAGVLIFFLGLGHLFRGRPATGGGHVVVGTPLAVGGFALALLGLNTQTYSRLTHEGPVAEVSVKAIDRATSRYAVTVHRLDGSNRIETCELQGDDWVLSGRVQKWKAWANVLGLDATYTLNQLSNMYSSAARGNGKIITSCDIGGEPPQVDQYVPPDWVNWLTRHAYTVDRKFGDANYMPMADGAQYRVVITQTGFNAEPVNDAAKAANEGEK